MSGPAKSPTLVIQTAMFTRASTDSGLGSLVTGVFDHVPEDQPRPYVVVGDSPFITTPDHTHSGFGWETVITFGIWIEERGFKLAHQIKSRLIELFVSHVDSGGVVQNTLDLSPDFRHVMTKHQLDQELRDLNPRLRRSQLQLRVVSEQN